MPQDQRGLKAPQIDALIEKYRVNLPGKIEVIWQPLYDYQAGVAAATPTQLFFQIPQGQAGRTLEDTNMVLAGNIPKGQMFAITGIQVEFYPDLAPQVAGAGAGAAALNAYANDVYEFYRSGALVLTIGSKPYVEQGNLMKFAPVNRLGGFTGAATTVAATSINSVYAAATGREFQVRDLVLESSQNFSVNIVNRLAVSTTSVIGVTLNGWLFRNAQ